MPQSESVINLADLIAVLRERWLTLLTVLALVTGLASAAGLLLPVAYTASATVTVAPITARPFEVGSQQVNMATEREMAMSLDVAIRASADMEEPPDPTDIANALLVTAPSDSQVLVIRYTATTPELAAEGANSVAQAYLAVRRDTADQVARSLMDALQERIGELREDIPNDASSNEPDIAAIQQQITELGNEQSRLATVAVNPGRVISDATPPRAPSSISWKIVAAAGVAAGLIAGVVAVLIRERTDRKVRSVRRLAGEVKGAPVQRYGDRDLPDEVFRRAMLAMHRRGPWHVGEDDERPVVVAVISVGSEIDTAVSIGLRMTVISAGLSPLLLRDTESGDVSLVDQGWPTAASRKSWHTFDVVLIDAHALRTISRRAALAERSDHVVLVVSAHAQVNELRELMVELVASDARPSVAILYSRSSQERPARLHQGESEEAHNGAPLPEWAK